MSQPPTGNLPNLDANRPTEVQPVQIVEMAELVAHEVNNLLNNILLHVAVLDRKGLAAAQAELAVIRQAGLRAGVMINRWQQLAPRRPPVLQPIDLNERVAGVLASWQAPPLGVPAIRFEPSPALPPVLGNAPDLERLVQLLVLHAIAATDKGAIIVRTERAASEVLLQVEDSGPALDQAALDRLFEPFFLARPFQEVGPDPQTEIGLALCKRLARRQQGSIHAENRPEGGLRVVVHFRPATDS